MAESIFCTHENGMETETVLSRDGWGWNKSSVGVGGDGSETGWGQVGKKMKFVGIGVICVPMQAAT